MAKKEKDAQTGTPVIKNRRAYHDYHILEEIEAGVVLLGSEVKVVRQGSFQIGEAYCRIKDHELWLVGSHIPEYPQASTHNIYDPNRQRKLLLHRSEIRKLERRVLEKGQTIIPLKVYFKGGRVKLLIGVAKGKKQYDKRETIKKRDVDRDLMRAGRADKR